MFSSFIDRKKEEDTARFRAAVAPVKSPEFSAETCWLSIFCFLVTVDAISLMKYWLETDHVGSRLAWILAGDGVGFWLLFSSGHRSRSLTDLDSWESYYAFGPCLFELALKFLFLVYWYLFASPYSQSLNGILIFVYCEASPERHISPVNLFLGLCSVMTKSLVTDVANYFSYFPTVCFVAGVLLLFCWLIMQCERWRRLFVRADVNCWCLWPVLLYWFYYVGLYIFPVDVVGLILHTNWIVKCRSLTYGVISCLY